MSTRDQELERMLGRDLHDQVDGMAGVHFGVEDVKGRARRIRRNRRASAGVGLAAALAVVLPVAMTAAGGPQGKDEIQPAPSPTATTAPVEVARTTLTLEGLERGDAPWIEYFTPDGVVLLGEGTQPLPENYQALVPVPGTGRWIALGAARDEVVYLSEDFEAVGRAGSSGSLVTTPSRGYAAWTVQDADRQGIVVVETTDPRSSTEWELPGRPAVEPVGILGPDSVVYETRDSQGRTAVGLANPDGSTTELPYVGASSADPVNGLIAVQTEVRDLGGCFGVADATSLELVWETCDYKLGSFSPDGRHVTAIPVESDGLGPTSVQVLDAATGELVAEFASEGRDVVTLVRPAWESDDAIVATALQGDTTTMVRMALDGTLEEVVDPVTTSDHGDLYYVIGQDRSAL